MISLSIYLSLSYHRSPISVYQVITSLFQSSNVYLIVKCSIIIYHIKHPTTTITIVYSTN